MEKYSSKQINEINTLDVFRELLSAKVKILKIIVIFLIIGIVLAVLSKKEYTASSIILPQVSAEKGLGSKLGGFAKLVGIKLGESGNNDIFPTLYPIIVKSTPYQKEILKTQLSFQDLKDDVSLSYYLENIRKDDILTILKKYTIGLPGKIFSSSKDKTESLVKLKDTTLYQINSLEKNHIDFLDDNLFVRFNDVEGYIEINAVMEEPLAAAQLAKKTQVLLQKYIIAYNIQKAKEELAYIENRLEEAKEDYYNKRATLGSYRDRNRNYISSVVDNRLEQLKTEYDLSYDVYSQLANQAETANLQVKKDTPIFTILKPVTVPIEPSAPNKLLIIFVCMVLGLFFGITLILFKLYYPVVREYLT